MADHVASVCRSGYYHMRQTRPTLLSLSCDTAKTLVQAFISSRLDYCNSVNAAVFSSRFVSLSLSHSVVYKQQQRLRGWSRMVVKNSKMANGRRFENRYIANISVKNHRMFMKFCTQQQISNWMNVTWSKMKKLHWTDSEFDRTYFLFVKR